MKAKDQTQIAQNLPFSLDFLLIHCCLPSINRILDHCVFFLRTQQSCHIPNIPAVHTAKLFRVERQHIQRRLTTVSSHTPDISLPFGISKKHHTTDDTNLQHELLDVVTSNPSQRNLSRPSKMDCILLCTTFIFSSWYFETVLSENKVSKGNKSDGMLIAQFPLHYHSFTISPVL